MRILRLEAENVKCLKAIEIEPDGSLVVVAGRNGAGKSSVLDAIEMALAGATSIPSVPVRRGADKARVMLDLGELVVERSFANGESRVTVRSKDGAVYRSPQALLDGLCSHVAFDPLEFSRLKPREQAEQLRALVGIDFTGLDAERKRAYEERTAVNRVAAQAEAVLASLPKHDAPAEEVSIADLTEELERRETVNRNNAALRKNLDDCRSEIGMRQRGVEMNRARVTELAEQLAAAETRLDNSVEELRAIQKETEDFAEMVTQLSDADMSEVKQQLRAAEAVNAKVRANAARESKRLELAEIEAESTALTERIDDVDRRKRNLLERAKFPVEGLGFDEAGVTYRGLPFDQASSAERLRVSAAMGMARKPKLRVMLIRDGSLLDEANWSLLAEMASTNEYQLWLETCQPGAPASVVIVDGEAHAPQEAKDRELIEAAASDLNVEPKV